jgi:DNA replication licensing factor MCM4
MDIIEDLHKSQDSSLTIDCRDLHSYSADLYQQLIMYPQEIIPMMDVVVNNLFEEHKAPLSLSDHDERQNQIDLVSEK